MDIIFGSNKINKLKMIGGVQKKDGCVNRGGLGSLGQNPASPAEPLVLFRQLGGGGSHPFPLTSLAFPWPPLITLG